MHRRNMLSGHHEYQVTSVTVTPVDIGAFMWRDSIWSCRYEAHTLASHASA